jgi:tetratricopeptide (TPR) repeat protein
VAAVIGLTLVAVFAVVFSRRPTTPTPDFATRSDSTPLIAVGEIGGDSLGEAVRGMLATGLARAEAVEVVSSARMLELQGAFTDAPSGTLRAAREAGASDLIEGTLLRVGNGWRLALTRTAVGEGTVAASVEVDGRELFALVDSATGRLLAGLTRRAAAGSVAEVSTRSITAWQLYQQALISQAGGRYDAARAQLRGALAEDEGFVMAAVALAYLSPSGSMEQIAMLRDAMRMRERAPRRDADFVRALWLLAENDPAAAAVFDTLALRYPDDLDIRMNLANPALFQRADFRAAYAALESAWRADSIRIGRSGGGRCYACEVPIHITTVAEHEDSLAVGERWLRRYLALAPEDGRAWDRLGAILERDVRRHRELEDVVARAVRNGHTYARGLHMLAAVRRGDTAAVARLEREVVAANDSAGLHWNRTLVYRNVGRLDDAMREAQAHSRHMARLPEPPVAPGVLEAVVYLERGEGRRAAEIWERIGRIAPRDTLDPLAARRVVWNRTLAASARFEAGDTAGLLALADSLAVIGLRSRYIRDHYLHHHVRGLAWLAQGRLDEATAELQRSIVFPSMGLTRSNWYLAQALRRQGRNAEARRVLEAAARAPRDGAGLYLNPVAVRAALRELQ